MRHPEAALRRQEPRSLDNLISRVARAKIARDDISSFQRWRRYISGLSFHRGRQLLAVAANLGGDFLERLFRFARFFQMGEK